MIGASGDGDNGPSSGAAYVFSFGSSPNNVPTANAGDDMTVTIDEYCRVTSAIPGKASDADNDALRYRWLEGQTELSAWNDVGSTGEADLNLCAISLGLGTHTLTLEVSDGKEVTASDSMTLKIVYPFSNFFQPVDNPPTINTLKAGAGVPVRFSLTGYRGLEILAATSSNRIDCPGASLDAIEQLMADRASTLKYDSTTDQYIYVWITDKAWAGTCRKFTLTLTGGTDHNAYFQFR